MDLPEMKPLAVVTAEDVRASLQGLSPGWYRAAYLHERYNDHVRSKGQDTVHGVAVGQVLRQIGAQRRRKKFNGKVISGWMISRADLEGEEYRASGVAPSDLMGQP